MTRIVSQKFHRFGWEGFNCCHPNAVFDVLDCRLLRNPLGAKDRSSFAVLQFIDEELAMWRAFFFAVGTMLIILGLECLVTEQFVVSHGRVSKVLAKIIDDKPSNSNQPNFPRLTMNPTQPGQMGGNPNATMGPNAGLPFQPSPASMSKYGPSRFDDNFANQSGMRQDFYGGVPSTGRAPNSPFSLTGFGNPNGSGTGPAMQPMGQLGPPMNLGAPVDVGPKTQVLTPKDWMPWSLLAAGSLVVLYTNSTSRGSYSND